MIAHSIEATCHMDQDGVFREVLGSEMRGRVRGEGRVVSARMSGDHDLQRQVNDLQEENLRLQTMMQAEVASAKQEIVDVKNENVMLKQRLDEMGHIVDQVKQMFQFSTQSSIMPWAATQRAPLPFSSNMESGQLDTSTSFLQLLQTGCTQAPTHQ